jgi:hypothetical protein
MPFHAWILPKPVCALPMLDPAISLGVVPSIEMKNREYRDSRTGSVRVPWNLSVTV